ncbi:MAG: PH domain-containing protein [Candidatus Endonucleobacter sp. (ex Gigantidas childressi)]|nr:PH domain-containing protein [Candidatus Endonucleobacter sp. (ex Gigantidas childressi)]
MSYIEESLSKGERIYQTFPHHWMVKVAIVVHFILAVFTMGVWLIPAILIWLGWRNTEQGVTNKRVIYKHGIISRKTYEMKLSAIESIIIKQGILGRILGYGTIIITGRGASDVTIRWITDPMRVKREIESADYVETEAA